MENMRERIPSELIRDMRDATLLRGTARLRGKNGVLGVSPLILFPSFNHVWGYGVDYLHPVLLGVFKDIVQYMMTRNQPYSLGGRRTMRSVERRIKNIRPPFIVPHTPKGFKEQGVWKACDIKALLLWYFIPVLNDVWRPAYLNHIACLIEGVTLLLQKEITPADRRRAAALLKLFGRDMERLYGCAAETYNVHMISTHFVKSVEMVGNLWAMSTFPYESENLFFKQQVTASKGVPLQIAERVIRKAFLPQLKEGTNPSEQVCDFVDKVASSGKQKRSRPGQRFVEINGCSLSNSKYEERALTHEESEILHVDTATEFTKLVYKKRTRTSGQYTRSKKWDNSYVRLQNGDYGHIVRIFVVNEENGDKTCKCLIKIFRVRRMVCGNVTLSHIFECYETNICTAVGPSEIAENVIFIDHRNARTRNNFIVRFPNTFEEY